MHCGDPLGVDALVHDGKDFCCGGCKTVFTLIHEHGLQGFYDVDGAVGIKQIDKATDFAYLDEPDTLREVCEYVDDQSIRVNFVAPAIHCASCLWLLERLPRLYPAVRRSRVDLLSRRITIVINREEGKLSEVAEWLERLGYPPELRLDNVIGEKAASKRKGASKDKLGLKIGVAGFAAGNVMLLAIPEYFGMSMNDVATWRPMFSAISIALAVPVLGFSGGTYLRGAYRAIRYKRLNIDMPIALGMIAMFGHSIYEIFSGTGAGYLDSLLGLIFFLLVGRWFQRQTHRRLAFDRDYRSYLPLAARVKTKNGVRPVRLDKLTEGHQVEIANGELVPADAVLVYGKAALDKSYITGEDEPQPVELGGVVYAGSRQRWEAILIELTGKVDSSYLARLWSESSASEADDSAAIQERATSKLLDKVGQYFTIVTLAVAVSTFTYWVPTDLSNALRAATAVLIVACPCAASLSLPFVYGRLAAIASQRGLAIRDALVVERFAEVDASAFDKTGTLTRRDSLSITELVVPATVQAAQLLALARHSTHPLSQVIKTYLEQQEEVNALANTLFLTEVEEQVGEGVSAVLQGRHLFLGKPPVSAAGQASVAFIIDEQVCATYRLHSAMRAGAEDLMAFAKTQGAVMLISGDGDQERVRWEGLFGKGNCAFRQNPSDKLRLIDELRDAGKHVLYLGDGLNDAGALKSAYVGIAVADEGGGFNPACDAILAAESVDGFEKIWRFLAGGRTLVYLALTLAIAYNLTGLAFAVTGNLEPVVAAILMPISSLTIIAWAWVGSWVWGRIVL
jgi:Cu+-exporting ATPase